MNEVAGVILGSKSWLSRFQDTYEVKIAKWPLRTLRFCFQLGINQHVAFKVSNHALRPKNIKEMSTERLGNYQIGPQGSIEREGRQGKILTTKLHAKGQIRTNSQQNNTNKIFSRIFAQFTKIQITRRHTYYMLPLTIS